MRYPFFLPGLLAILLIYTVSVVEGVLSGWDARPGEFPLSIVYFGPKQICGGVLISWKHVLTAAHCLQNSTLLEIDGSVNILYVSSTAKRDDAKGAWFSIEDVY